MQGGKLAGIGAHSYSAGNATKGSEEAAAACAAMLMMLTRTVHPPAGSNPVIIFAAQPGWSFLLMPTLLGAVALVVTGWIYWRAVKRGSWPLRWN